jgi:hypothetical protein
VSEEKVMELPDFVSSIMERAIEQNQQEIMELLFEGKPKT